MHFQAIIFIHFQIFSVCCGISESESECPEAVVKWSLVPGNRSSSHGLKTHKSFIQSRMSLCLVTVFPQYKIILHVVLNVIANISFGKQNTGLHARIFSYFNPEFLLILSVKFARTSVSGRIHQTLLTCHELFVSAR